MANATLRDLSADTSIATTDVLPKQGTSGALKKVTGTTVKSELQSGGSIALSLAADQVAAAGADTRIQYNNGTARGGDAEVTWDNSGKALTVGAVTTTTQLKLPADNSPGSPALAFGDGDSGIFDIGSGVLKFAIAGVDSGGIASSELWLESGGAQTTKIVDEAASSTNPTLTPYGGDTNTGVGLAAADQLSLIAGGVELARMSESATDQVMFYAPKASLAGGDFGIKQNIRTSWFASSFGLYVDESAHKLEFWALYADGTTAKKHELALA
jgi:hypothetical protein